MKIRIEKVEVLCIFINHGEQQLHSSGFNLKTDGFGMIWARYTPNSRHFIGKYDD